MHLGLRLAIALVVATGACAVSLTARLPVHVAIVLTAVAVAGAVLLLHHDASRRHAALVARLEAIKGVRTSGARLQAGRDPGRRLQALVGGLVQDLEEAYYRLIRTNIQLLSLKEFGRSIIASLDRDRTVESVLEYLHRGVGFHEFALFAWRPAEGVFDGRARCRTGDGWSWTSRRFAFGEVDGVLAGSLGRLRSALIKDAEVHPLGMLGGEALFPDSRPGSFVVVPLVSSTPPGDVWERRGCAAARCPAAPGAAVRDWREKFTDEPDADYWNGGRFRCWSCAGFPILGALVVTDTNRDGALSKIDLIMLETLAQNLAMVLENARLYEELRREERLREHVFQSLSNGLVSVDLQGEVRLFNQAAERLSGQGRGAVVGRACDGMILDTRTGQDALRETLASGRVHAGLEATLATADGRGLPIRLVTSLLRDESGNVHGVIGEFADQSGIKRMEAMIRHLDKLAALGRFTSSIAHEIRNPLAGITAGMHYLRKRMDGVSQEHMDFILAEVDRMNRIIEDLFRVGRPLELNLQDVDVEALAERSLRALEPRAAERGVRCVKRVATDLPLLVADPDRLEQVFINLIQNAVDASPEGGTVDLELRLGSSRDPLDRAAAPDSLVVTIHDRGDGIPEEHRDRIFEPFFTTKARGTGLGLYVCHHIVEGHGGSIVVDSSCGQGTRFVLCLPLGRILLGGLDETADLARR
jgi:PAS domain S-box-containing protein